MTASQVRVPEDYTKKKHVLRVSSVRPCRSELLLQADNPSELADWVKALQEQAATITDSEDKYVSNLLLFLLAKVKTLLDKTIHPQLCFFQMCRYLESYLVLRKLILCCV